MTLDELRASRANVLSIGQTVEVFADVGGDRPDERTVRRACEDGQLPCVRVGRRMFVPRLALIALLEGNSPRHSEGVAATATPNATTNPPATSLEGHR